MPAILIETLEAAREDYLDGKGNLKEIAERFALTYSTVRAKAFAGNWKLERSRRVLEKRNAKRSGAILGDILPLPPNASFIPPEPVNPEFFHKYGARYYQHISALDRHINKINALIEATNDENKIRVLTTALISLLNMSRIMQNIPAPATRKYKERKADRTIVAPIESEHFVDQSHSIEADTPIDAHATKPLAHTSELGECS